MLAPCIFSIGVPDSFIQIVPKTFGLYQIAPTTKVDSEAKAKAKKLISIFLSLLISISKIELFFLILKIFICKKIDIKTNIFYFNCVVCRYYLFLNDKINYIYSSKPQEMKSTFTILVLFLISFSSFAEVSDAEKNALIKLNNATNGGQWTTKWNLNTAVSTWYGVKVVNDKVVAIDLSSNNLAGVLPSEISDLQSLKSLVLFQNKITGTIPASIGKLSSLEVLNVSFNQLSGEIPTELCNATSLKTIELFMNGLTGSIPSQINKLNKLEFLSLYNNLISGAIPSELYQITTLKVLQLNSNQLTGSLSREIANLTKLENLSLFDNKMVGQIPFDLEKLNNLKEMNISYNNFNGFISTDLAKKDMLKMTMVNEYGVASALKVVSDKNVGIAETEE